MDPADLVDAIQSALYGRATRDANGDKQLEPKYEDAHRALRHMMGHTWQGVKEPTTADLEAMREAVLLETMCWLEASLHINEFLTNYAQNGRDEELVSRIQSRTFYFWPHH